MNRKEREEYLTSISNKLSSIDSYLKTIVRFSRQEYYAIKNTNSVKNDKCKSNNTVRHFDLIDAKHMLNMSNWRHNNSSYQFDNEYSYIMNHILDSERLGHKSVYIPHLSYGLHIKDIATVFRKLGYFVIIESMYILISWEYANDVNDTIK
jgi:hypothetical protein